MQKIFDRELERLRVPPSPNKKLTGSLAWRDDDIGVTTTTQNESDFWTEFETQEVLLHNSCSLIRLLVLDCPKVRVFLTAEMESYWFGIMHSFNLLFPRPDEDKILGEQKKSDDTQAGSKERQSFVSKYFSACRPRAATDITVTEEQVQELTISEKNKKYPLLFLTDYGRPTYDHLSVYSWELLLLARRAMEDTVKMLELNVSLVRDEMPNDEELMRPTELINKDDEVAPHAARIIKETRNTPTLDKPKQSATEPRYKEKDAEYDPRKNSSRDASHRDPGNDKIPTLSLGGNVRPLAPTRPLPFSPSPSPARPNPRNTPALSTPVGRSAPSEERISATYSDIQARRKANTTAGTSDMRSSQNRSGRMVAAADQDRPNRAKNLQQSVPLDPGPPPSKVIFDVKEQSVVARSTTIAIPPEGAKGNQDQLNDTEEPIAPKKWEVKHPIGRQPANTPLLKGHLNSKVRVRSVSPPTIAERLEPSFLIQPVYSHNYEMRVRKQRDA